LNIFETNVSNGRQTMKTVKITNGNAGRRENPYPSCATMDAIAFGVQAKLDERTSFSRRVTDETVNTARALGVSNAVIERWEAERLNQLAQETERLRRIRALLDRSSQRIPEWMTKSQV
jgi:hypothetical protein